MLKKISFKEIAWVKWQKMKIRDKWNKKKINNQKANNLTEIQDKVSLQKKKYYNKMTINDYP